MHLLALASSMVELVDGSAWLDPETTTPEQQRAFALRFYGELCATGRPDLQALVHGCGVLTLDADLRAGIEALVTLPAEPAWVAELGDIVIQGVEKQAPSMGEMEHYVIDWVWPSGLRAAADIGVHVWGPPSIGWADVDPSVSDLRLMNSVRYRGVRGRPIMLKTARPVLRKAVAAANDPTIEFESEDWLVLRPFVRWLVDQLTIQARRPRPKAA